MRAATLPAKACLVLHDPSLLTCLPRTQSRASRNTLTALSGVAQAPSDTQLPRSVDPDQSEADP
jgi:hypothetical protein